nr:polysaccharide biosynthesis/export family protein [Pontibacter qinzhouensis]
MTNRELAYMQNDRYNTTTPTSAANSPKPYKLQANDVLSVKVQSEQPELSNLFNIVDPASTMAFGGPSALYLAGYTIDEAGFLTLPTIGKLKVVGLTSTQTQDLIQQNLNKYLVGTTVIVKLLSFKVSVLGGVRNPGYYYVYNEQANLLEGLSLAGDLTQAGDRKRVKLIRQTTGGSEVIILDLTDPNLVQSPYYYLMPNDVLYIDPLKTQLKRENLVVVTALLGVISTGVLLLNYFR